MAVFMADASTGWSSRNEIVSAVFRRSHPAVYGLIRQKKEQIMEELIIPALKISLLTTPTILAIVALVQIGSLKSDLGRTKSVLKAAMVEIERLSRKLQ